MTKLSIIKPRKTLPVHPLFPLKSALIRGQQNSQKLLNRLLLLPRLTLYLLIILALLQQLLCSSLEVQITKMVQHILGKPIPKRLLQRASPFTCNRGTKSPGKAQPEIHSTFSCCSRPKEDGQGICSWRRN